MKEIKEINDLEKNVPSFSNELYKSSMDMREKEKTILMLLKNHKHALKQTGRDHGDLLGNADLYHNVEVNTRHNNKLNSDPIISQRSISKSDNRANHLNKLVEENQIKENNKKGEKKKEGIQLAPEINYEANCRYYNEPKIVSRDNKIKIVFPGEEKDTESELILDFGKSYIREQKIAIKADYLNDYKKYQEKIYKELTQNPSGISLYHGTRTFLNENQIKNIEKMEHDIDLMPNSERDFEEVKPKLKYVIPSLDNFDVNKFIESLNENNKKNNKSSKDKNNDKEDKKLAKKSSDFNIEKVIEAAEIRKNNFSLLYTDQDKEYGRKLEKWKKYKYILGQGKEKGKLLKYSIWRKDIFVQKSGEKGEDDDTLYQGNNKIIDYKIKKNLLKNKEVSDRSKNLIKNDHVLSLLEWNEARKQEFKNQLRKESQTLHSYMCQLKKEKELQMLNEDLLSSNKSNKYQNLRNKSSLTSSNRLHSSLNPLLTSNKTTPKKNNTNQGNKDTNPRLEASKLNSFMRKENNETKVNYIRDYGSQSDKLSKESHSKDIFNDNSSVMANIKNFTIDRFINEYKSYIKSRETIWNRENNVIRKGLGSNKDQKVVLDIVTDIMNETANSDDPYIQCKFRSNYSGDTDPEYITYIMNLLIKKNGIWTDKELVQIRGFLSNLRSFKKFNKDFINNVIYNSRILYFDKNTVIDIKNKTNYYFVLCGTVTLKYINIKNSYNNTNNNNNNVIASSDVKSNELTTPKIFGNDYYNRRRSCFNPSMNNAGTNRVYEYYRRNSNNANSFKRENVRIKQIGDYFNTFSTIDNNYLLDLVTTTTPSYLLEIEKGNYEKFKKMIEEKEKQEKTAFLKTLSIFKTFSYDSLFNFSECVEYRTIPCGQTILNFNQPLDEFYIIKRGKCNVYRRLFLERDGQVKTAKIYVGQFGPGDYFGERGIIEYHGFLHIKNIEIIDQFFSNPIADKDPILSELCVVAVKDKCEPSIYDTELDQQEINYTNKSNANDSTTPDFLKQTISIEEKKFQQKKIREEKTIELAVIALNKARLKFQNTIEYSKFEKLSQDELYCKYLESSEEKNWNKLKEHLNNGRLKEILNDPTITVSKLDEMKGKERWKI